MSVLQDALEWLISEVSPAEVTEVGPRKLTFLLERDQHGARYVLPPVPRPVPAAPLYVAHHRLGSFEALKAWTVWGLPSANGSPQIPRSVWVAEGSIGAKVAAQLDAVPEAGVAVLELPRSPEWQRWARVVGSTAPVDLSHEDLAELLLDNEEDLEEPALAKLAAQFRGVRTVEYDADLQGQGHVGLRVQFSGKGGAGNVALPREFRALLRGFADAWPRGEAPRRPATFRLRVVPPKGGASADARPVFRLYWLNRPEFEAEALDDLEAQVREVYGTRVVRGEFRAQSLEPYAPEPPTAPQSDDGDPW